MRIEKNISYGLLADPISNSPNNHNNCIADSKENYSCDLGNERVKSLTGPIARVLK